eukprot:8121643-Ditylum_brightwellii.AAC.2
MSVTELQNTLILCSLQEGDQDVLPVWFKQVAKKGTNNNTKNQAILYTLQNIIYDDAELSITVQLLTTIQKRK